MELSENLGHDVHDLAGRNGENWRNGTRAKTVRIEVGPVEMEIPRDQDGTSDPEAVKGRQRRLVGLDQIVLSLKARGLTAERVAAHFAGVYGATVSKGTVSRITAKVTGELDERQHRPLDRVHPVIFIDVVMIKVRDERVTNRPFYVVIGVATAGERDMLGIRAATAVRARSTGGRC